ncbi:MAG: hypothetical protein K0U93_18145 [Gammaproteobacteria bacterium]|nr:hypothetical protein [Gammaproteobacteria bacterium]
MTEPFDAITYANQTLAPLLAELCALTDSPGTHDQFAYFSLLHQQITGASDPGDIAEAFFNLSTSAFMGFHYDGHVAEVLDELLERAELLSETLAVSPGERH